MYNTLIMFKLFFCFNFSMPLFYRSILRELYAVKHMLWTVSCIICDLFPKLIVHQLFKSNYAQTIVIDFIIFHLGLRFSTKSKSVRTKTLQFRFFLRSNCTSLRHPFSLYLMTLIRTVYRKRHSRAHLKGTDTPPMDITLSCKYSRTSMARTSLGPWKFVRDTGSSRKHMAIF